MRNLGSCDVRDLDRQGQQRPLKLALGALRCLKVGRALQVEGLLVLGWGDDPVGHRGARPEAALAHEMVVEEQRTAGENQEQHVTIGLWDRPPGPE